MKSLILSLCLIATQVQATEFSFESDRSLPLVFVNVAMKGGATQDPEGKNGVTDLMTKLLLRGTKNKTKQQVDQTLDQLGASLETETRAEFVVLRGSVLSENIAPFLALLEEIISTPSFRPSEFEKLKKEQISGILDQLNNDQKLIRTRFDQIFFQGHPYAKANLGKIKDIQSLTVSDIQNQYKRIFDQSRMLVLAAGDTTSSSFNTFIQNINEKQNFKTTIEVIPPFKNAPKSLRVVIFDKPERTQTQIVIAQHGTSFQDPTLDAIQLGNFAFGGGSFLSKLMVELRVKRGWTYGAGSGFKMGSQPHTWRASFFPKNADTPPAIKEALRLIRDLRDHGITQKEFDAAKNSSVNSAGFTYNTPAKRIENMLVEKIFNLPSGYHKDTASRVQTLTLEDVNNALKKFIQPDQLMVGLVGTASISRAAIAKELGISEKSIEVVDYSF
jgi:zinc protease